MGQRFRPTGGLSRWNVAVWLPCGERLGENARCGPTRATSVGESPGSSGADLNAIGTPPALHPDQWAHGRTCLSPRLDGHFVNDSIQNQARPSRPIRTSLSDVDTPR